jgi:uncharacterized protein YukE
MRIKVTPENLYKAAKQIRSISNSFDKIEKQITRAKQSLQTGGFEGKFTYRAERKISKVPNSLRRLKNRTQELAKILESSAHRFESADGQSVKSLSRMHLQNISSEQCGILPTTIAVGAAWELGHAAGDTSNITASPMKQVSTGLEPPSLNIGSSLVGLTREQKLTPQRRGRPRKHEPNLRIAVWEDEIWEAPENTGHTEWGGVRFGGETHVKAGSGSAGIGVGLEDGEFMVGPYARATAFTAGTSGVIGDKDAGLAGGAEVKALEAEAFLGVRDHTVGAKIGGKLVSAEATVGGNIKGMYVGVVGGIGVEFELGISIGKKTRIDLGPFTLGLDIGEALGA